jgi:arginyl-tRNA synthetase
VTSISLIGKLTAIFSRAFESCGLDPRLSRVIISDRSDLGQFQCNGALAAARAEKKNPRSIAQAVIEAVQDREIFSDISIAGAGFINMSLTDSFLASHMREMTDDDRLGCARTSQPKNIIIDFGGPNVAKPMHVGHLRSTIIGDCLQRLLRFTGDDVTSDIHLGDWGLQMGMLICELRRSRPHLPYFDACYAGAYPDETPVSIDDLEEMYPVASARCKSDEREMEAARAATADLQQGRLGYRALWKHFVSVSVNALKDDFGRLGVTFDLWRGESYYNDRLAGMIGELKARGHARVSEGAVVIPVSSPGDKKEIPPLILEKSEGGYLYGTTDLATIEERTGEFHADLILYVVDKRQHLHFEQVFRAARIVSFARNAGLEHIAFGTMNGPDGKPFKTRAGGVMKLKDLIAMVTENALDRMRENRIAEDFDEAERQNIAHQVGIATLKFADLGNHRMSDYVFDVGNFSRFEGRTGPYLLYTAVRIKSILRKATEEGLNPGPILAPTVPVERELMLNLSWLPEKIRNSCAERAPNYLCDFVYTLAQVFSRFYQQCHILSEKDPAVQSSWLALSQLCLRELELVLSLLGMNIPGRM